MKIHEYQAKELLKKYNVSIPLGGVAFSSDEAMDVGLSLNEFPLVIKAQIHAGGRGKCGGVRFAQSLNELTNVANEMIGMNLVTPQTGCKGKLVKKVLIEKGIKIAKEFYLSISTDRLTAKNIIIVSEAGGVDIEKTTANIPRKIIKTYIDPTSEIPFYKIRELFFGLNLPFPFMGHFAGVLIKLYGLFIDYGCSLLEINPLVLSEDNDFVALDAKVEIDDSALFRHADIIGYRDIDEQHPLETKASQFNLNFIKLDNGNVGSMVNGAGLAMATMDIIKQVGAEPANFLDIGGGANEQMVENGFKIILSDSCVKVVFINIFGGILRCDMIATGVVKAVTESDIKVPVVVRMEGTNAEQGHLIFAKSGLNFITASDLKDASEKISGLVKRCGK